MGYLKISTSVVYSENSDYSDPTIQPRIIAEESDPTGVMSILVTAVVSPGVTIDLSPFESVSHCLVTNLGNDAGDYVRLTYNQNSVASQAKIISGATVSVGECTVANDLILISPGDGVPCLVQVFGNRPS